MFRIYNKLNICHYTREKRFRCCVICLYISPFVRRSVIDHVWSHHFCPLSSLKPSRPSILWQGKVLRDTLRKPQHTYVISLPGMFARGNERFLPKGYIHVRAHSSIPWPFFIGWYVITSSPMRHPSSLIKTSVNVFSLSLSLLLYIVLLSREWDTQVAPTHSERNKDIVTC